MLFLADRVTLETGGWATFSIFSSFFWISSFSLVSLFFFWVLSLRSCSVFRLSVLFSLFSFLSSCFFLLSPCSVSVSFCGSLFVSLFVLFACVMSSLRLLPCSPSRPPFRPPPLSWPFSGFYKARECHAFVPQ